ncbi:hypothetical protein Y032_0313g2199 [Ancylostoma ceylanicum]|uniref:Uncharacterized protein n=1 Tax=Ancylostoma ceylanicum TaxID=53326 RepID=A0A016S2T5_9BILA|nr:hypothetical protein Y032_0313g2199 [Ancylostoma ceylanicum]
MSSIAETATGASHKLFCGVLCSEATASRNITSVLASPITLQPYNSIHSDAEGMHFYKVSLLGSYDSMKQL